MRQKIARESADWASRNERLVKMLHMVRMIIPKAASSTNHTSIRYHCSSRSTKTHAPKSLYGVTDRVIVNRLFRARAHFSEARKMLTPKDCPS